MDDLDSSNHVLLPAGEVDSELTRGDGDGKQCSFCWHGLWQREPGSGETQPSRQLPDPGEVAASRWSQGDAGRLLFLEACLVPAA